LFRGGIQIKPTMWEEVTTPHHPHLHDEAAVEGGNHHDHGISMTWPEKAVREDNLYK
jgi:hypothetical protein